MVGWKPLALFLTFLCFFSFAGLVKSVAAAASRQGSEILARKVEREESSYGEEEEKVAWCSNSLFFLPSASLILIPHLFFDLLEKGQVVR